MKKILFLFLCVLFGLSASLAQSVGQKNQSNDDILRNEVRNLQRQLYKTNFVLLKKVSPKFYIFPIRVITFKGEKSNFVLAVFSTEFNVAVETGNTSCGNDNGWVKVYIEGGQPPYIVKIDNQVISSPWEKYNLPAGDYRVQVDDQIGNQYLLYKARVDASTVPTISLSFVSGSCGITSSVINGVPPYSFKWSNGAETPNLLNLVSGNYKVTVTDGHGCTDTESIRISCATVTYSNIITRNNCDSLSVLKLDTVKTGLKSFNTGLDSSNIFRNVFAKTYYKDTLIYSCNSADTGTIIIPIKYHGLNCDTLILKKSVVFKPLQVPNHPVDTFISGPANMFGQMRSVVLTDTGCITYVVYRYVSGLDTVDVTEFSCIYKPVFYRISNTQKSIHGFDRYEKVTTIVSNKPKITNLIIQTCDQSLSGVVNEYPGQTSHGCDTIRRDSFYFVATKTNERDSFVCGLQKDYDIKVVFPKKLSPFCDSLISVVHVKSGGVSFGTKTLPLMFTCDPQQAGERRDTFKNQYGCIDSIHIIRTRYNKPLTRVDRFTTCDKTQADSVFKIYYYSNGCDSLYLTTVTTYVGSPITILPKKEFCGVKNSDIVVDSLFSNIYGCDSLVRQRIVESPAVKIKKIETKLPIYGDGWINVLSSGGTPPLTWKDQNGELISSERFDLPGGLYPTFIEDARGCKVDTVVVLPSLAIINDGGEYFIVGGHMTPDVMKILGSYNATYRVVTYCGKVLDSGNIIDARQEIRIRLNVPSSEAFIVEIYFPKFKHTKKLFKS